MRYAQLFVLVLLAALAAAPVAAADFAEGLEAYDGGDYPRAVEIWRSLATGGDAEAQVALAGLYVKGVGVTTDASKAASLYRAAAEQGNADAQLNLGDMLARGHGVGVDLVGAYSWLTLASRGGRQWAEDRRRDIAATMTEAQIAEAGGRADTFVARKGTP